MAQPPQKKSPQPNRPQDKSGEDDFFDEFFRNAEPHQLDETPEPEQQRQWISDQLMWETTLGMREDETINRAITPEDKLKANRAGKPQSPAAKRQLSDQERRLLRTQVEQPAAAPKPAPSAVSATKPHRSQPQPNKAVARPAPQKAETSARAAIASKAPVKRVPQPQSPKSSAVTPQQTKTPANSSSGVKKSPLQSHPQNKTPNQAKRPVSSAHTQTQPVAMRKADLTLEDIEFDTAEEMVREKYFNWGKKIAAALSIAIVSFICGYYVGGSSASHTPVSQKDIDAALSKMEQSISKKPEQPAPKQSAPKKAKPKPTPVKQSSEPAPANTGSQQTNAGTASVFEGKEIHVEQFDQAASLADTSQLSPESTNAAYDEFSEAVASAIASETGTANFLPAPEAGMSTESVSTASATMDSGNTTITPEGPLQNLLDQSLQAFENQQWELLIELSNQILVKDPGVITALTNRAAAHTELGSYVEALADCNLAIKIEPNNPLAINNRGYVYEKMGDSQNAIADYEKACGLGVELSCQEAQRLKSGSAE
ncbi:MAG: hypothetical protein AMJ53_13685 [Gammaproteobacteria bacterium SG8_11]|nr:MAG: hypothetical protein AMJ53_13685 [Gammaproteobacteria bacterium SG8_11]